MKKTTFALSSFLSLAVPALALAQNATYINNWIGNIKLWLGQAVAILMVAMTVWFLWSVFQYIRESDPGKLADRRKVMINSLIGLFVSVSVWGIIYILGSVLGTNNKNFSPIISCPPGSYNTPTGGCSVSY